MYSYKNLKTPKNISNGVAQTVWYAPVQWFAVGGIKTAPDSGAFGDEIVIADTHIFNPGKGFLSMLLAPDKNDVIAKTIGDSSFQKFEQELRFFIPGSYKELHQTARNLLNTPLIVLIKDANCPANMWYQLGDDLVYAFITLDFTTGTTQDGVKGYQGVIKYYTDAVYLYAGAVAPFTEVQAESPVFLAPYTTEELTGDIVAMRAAYAGAQSTNISTIYSSLLANADAEVLQLYLLNNAGRITSDIVQVDLSSELNFIESLKDWLADNGGDQTLVDSGSQLTLMDQEATETFLGIAMPQNILGGSNYIFGVTGNYILQG